MPMDEAQLREQVARELGTGKHRLRADVWSRLVASGQVEAALAALNGGWATTQVADLAADYHDLDAELARGSGGRPPRSERKRLANSSDDRRTRALASILAAMAECEEVVGSVRQELLGGRLLRAEELVGWIETRSHAQRPVHMARILLPEGVHGFDPVAASRGGQSYAEWLAEVASAAAEQQLQPRFSESSLYDLLAYAGPGETWLRHVFVNPDSELARLKSAASELAGRYYWQEERAVAFILTGLAPPLSTVTVRTTRRPIPALDRIAVEADPRTSAAELAKVYAAARTEFSRVRDKEMHDKHLALSVFTEAHRDSGLTWPRLRAGWNAAVKEAQPSWGFDEPRPQWAYGEEDPRARRFATDCRNAWTRVTGLTWQRAEGKP